MPATRKFIEHPVGDKAINKSGDVRALQRLLIAAGETLEGGVDGNWGDKTAKALASFQSRHHKEGLKPKRLVTPGEYSLLLMAWRAGILIPMPGKAGMPGVLAMQEWFTKGLIKYNAGAEKGQGNRAIWGLDGDPRYCVQTTSGHFAKGPVEMDCTTYVNLMISIFMNGHAHTAPYDARCSAFGGTSPAHCGRDRYGLPLVSRQITVKAGTPATVNYFETAEQLAAATASDTNGLYVIEVAATGTGSVSHMTLLHNGTVYECTTGQSGSSCIQRSIADFAKLKKGKIYYLFGPSPTRR